MQHVPISTSKAPSPAGAYSQAVRADRIVATAGQVGIDPTNGVVPDGIAAQTRRCLENVEQVLVASGATVTDVIKTSCFLSDIDDFAAFNAAYAAFFGDHRPARTTVQVVLARGYLVEIDALAVVTSQSEA